MMANGEPASKVALRDLVLVGGGHSHLAVLRAFGRRPMAGVRLTLICREAHTPYSGMLPGLIAGTYKFDEAHIDLRPLAQFAGARFFFDDVTGLDLSRRRVHCSTRPPVPFDLLSINIGATPSMEAVPGARDFAIPVKPIGSFLKQWQGVIDKTIAKRGRIRLGFVGAGAGGVELALAANATLRATLRELPGANNPELHLFAAKDDILTSFNHAAARSLQQRLLRNEIRIHNGFRVAEVTPDGVSSADGRTLPLDAVVWVTNAAPADWIARAGIEVDEQGFMSVDRSLRSVSHSFVFGAGDIASIVGCPRPKSGVFAVRQGPVLSANLKRALTGRRLRVYRPQRHFLSLIGTGNGEAVAAKGRLFAEGQWVWRLKQSIDRRFMRKYADLPDRPSPEGPTFAPGLASAAEIALLRGGAMRCGGCGGKLGAAALAQLLPDLRRPTTTSAVVGLETPDDAAVLPLDENYYSLQSVDCFRAVVDDPYLFGRIATVHALSDIYAMGGVAGSALAIAMLPFGLPRTVAAELEMLMSGVQSALEADDVELVGGHSGESQEALLGLAVTGRVLKNRLLRKGGMRAGDQLILTKSLGTGVILAADMRARAKARQVEAALRSMLLSNRAAVDCLVGVGATACTDVTGYGLAGHLTEMANASRACVEIELATLPVLEGALELLQSGFRSSLHAQNVESFTVTHEGDPSARSQLAFDPQTAGGLLASVPDAQTETCLRALKMKGFVDAARVGRVLSSDDARGEVHLVG